MSLLLATARGVLRGSVFPALTAGCFLDYALSGARHSLPARVAWMRRCALRHARWCNLRIRVHGTVPRCGLIVANHVGYLDIIGLSAAAGCAFVAKKEIASWPLFGAYARCGGTIFVDRERRGAVADVAAQMSGHLDAGLPLVLFPEGTSTDGTHVLPFRSSLLEPAVQLAQPVTPCGLGYSFDDGADPRNAAYWGDMPLLVSILRVVSRAGVILDIRFGPPRDPAAGRKQLATLLHSDVRTLASLPVAPAAL